MTASPWALMDLSCGFAADTAALHRRDELRGGGIKIDVGAAMIEMDAHVRITLRRFDHGGVQRGAANRVDEFVRIAVVGGKMEGAGFVVDHAAAHRNGVPQHFIGDAELFERVNSAGRKREIDRAPADDVSLARISAPFVKIDIVTAAPQVRGEQSAGEAAADENKLCRHSN